MKHISWKWFTIFYMTLGALFFSGFLLVSAHTIDMSACRDDNPFMGMTAVIVTNTTTESWGGFHFQVFSIGYPVNNVDFIVSAPYQPVSSQNPLAWVVDNNPAQGSILDLYFYLNPVLPGQTALFRIFTDNSVDKKPFGVMFYPTVVPVPASIWLFCAGLLGLAAIKKKLHPVN